MISELFLERLNYCIYVILLLIGLWAMLAKRNLIKKLIGMSIFQTAIILFYVSIAVKDEKNNDSYLFAEHDPHAGHSQVADEKASLISEYSHGPVALKPETIKDTLTLQQAVMLTAIMVSSYRTFFCNSKSLSRVRDNRRGRIARKVGTD